MVDLPKDGEPFQPANGMDGIDFMAIWCARCQCEPDTDPQDGGEGCPILGESMALKPDDEMYPRELIWMKGEGHCTAFIESDGSGVVLNPRAVAAKRDAYAALPRDPKTGRPII